MKKHTFIARLRPALLLGTSLAVAMPSLAADPNPALQALFGQANYWHQKAHDNLAQDALQKVLLMDANNTEALYLLSLWAQQNGDHAAAEQWRKRLVQASPSDLRLAELDNARQIQSIPPAQLSLARQLASSGNVNASLQTWRNTFPDGQPPDSVAAEYYLTMAGDRAQLSQAIGQLRNLVSRRPQDTRAMVALGSALTYQEGTRREGIRTLESLADGNKEADRALRQALLWLGPQTADEAFYETYLQRHPQDSAVMEHYRNHASGAAKGGGFTALNSGDLAQARSAFDQVLKNNPQDADALAGLGYIEQRNGNYLAAADYLERSAQQGGDDSPQRRQQASDARFYAQLAVAQQALKTGNIEQALTLSAPLIQAEGEKGVAAQLFRADVLRRTGKAEQAEQMYRTVLQSDAGNRNAREGLFYLLRQQNRTAEANTLLASLPASVRQSLQSGTPENNGDAYRQQAKQAVATGDAARAISLLRQGMQRAPTNPWIRLDLARVYRSQGDTASAASVMQSVYREGARSEDLYAGAIYASESNAWQQASSLIGRIPLRSQNAAMRELGQRARFNLSIVTAEQYLSQGSMVAAANTLKALTAEPPASPADAGKLARGLARSGDLTAAVAVVRGNMQRGVKGNAGDYADQIAVLNQAGLNSEALNFLSNPELQSRSTPEQLAGMRNGYVINEADRLRLQKNYAEAYDKLINALQQDPQNTDLMLAMARLYQSGKMNKEAGTVYHYLMARDTPNQDARVGAINVALAESNVETARALAHDLQDKQSPDRLLLLARLSDAEGNHDQALRYLRSARGQMTGLQGAEAGNLPSIAGLTLVDNPFLGRGSRGAVSASSRGDQAENNAMPWQRSPNNRSSDEADDILAGRNDVVSQQARTLHQIDTMMDALNQRTGTWAQAGVQIRGRDGESGLSKLTEAKAPLSWSSVPFGDSRFEFTVTPVSLSAGTAGGDAYRRSGSGSVANAVSNLVTTINNEGSASPNRELDDFRANEKNAGVDTSILTDNVTFEDLNPLTADGKKKLAAIDPRLMSYLAHSSRRPSVTAESSAAGDSKNASGVELNLALTGDRYKVDLGSTPLGQDLSTLVGGVQWSPKLTDYLTLILTGERRAVTDSLLSYVGTEDKMSGKRWGRVTKNGGNALLSYDDGDVGFYGGAGAYSYLGEDVASNKSLLANAGAYVRPFHYADRELKTGISLSWMNYSKNLSYFSYGQGGYFSPQNYTAASFPVDFSQKFDDLQVKVGGSVGYQSYTQDRSAYFPRNPEWQSYLESAVDNGFAKEAFYSGTSKNGIGYNLHAGADYKVSNHVTLSGQLGYDTFGDYKESTAQLWFRYMLGDK